MASLSDFAMLLACGVRGALVLAPVDPSRAIAESVHRGEIRPIAPIRYGRNLGKRELDLVEIGYAGHGLVSERAVEVLRSARLTGWSTYPIEIVDWPTTMRYQGLAVSGRSGPLDLARSERITMPPATPQGRTVPGLRGLPFDVATWDGCDFFLAGRSPGIILSAAAKQAITVGRLTNFCVTRLTEFEQIDVGQGRRS